MKVAVCNEVSTRVRNSDILRSLEKYDLEVFNVGMSEADTPSELTYIHTGFLSALLLKLKKVDYAIGGCGTGIGYLNSVLQYPGVVCGHILSPLDAWLFSEINHGNCIALALNQGYGWAAEKNLQYIFEQIFGVKHGLGYPKHRAESQAASRKTMSDLSAMTHIGFADIVQKMPSDILETVLSFPGVGELIGSEANGVEALKASILRQLGQK